MKYSNAIIALLSAFSAVTTKAFTVSLNNHAISGRVSTAAPAVPSVLSSLKMSTTDEEVETSVELSAEFKGAMEKTIEGLKAALPDEKLLGLLEHFTTEYFTACQQASNSGNDKVTAASTAKNMMNALQYGMKYGLGDKFSFGTIHTALRGNPENEDGNEIDFYAFGCNFFGPAMDLDNSPVLGVEFLKKASEQLKNGENVVLLANHQSEADPQVVSKLLEKVDMTEEAENLFYVAGHKVTTDALAIPFSMGRNLICIHSKKHIDADPETKPKKQKQNLTAMNGMLGKLKAGGTMIWVAPSGGRDRRNVETGDVPLAPFDQKTVDMFRLMGNKSKVPTHFYSFSMVSYDLCPPPDFVEAGTGEQRNVRFVPVGISCSEEIENEGGVESRQLFSEKAFEACQKGYDELLSKMQ